MTNQDVSRRSFLKSALATAVAASATGASAALYNQALPDTAITSVSNSPVGTAVSAPTNLTDTDTVTRLVAAQAENVRLQAALEVVQSQLANLQQNNQAPNNNSDALALELSQANEHIGVLAGLIALYEQFAAVDVETAVQTGLAAFSGSFTTLLADLPSLSESIQIGRQALQNFESQVPVLENGRLWLIDHLSKVEGYFQIVEQLLTQAVDQIGPFLQMLTDWFESIKKWLPFGIGQTATTIMQAITNLILETPNTISGLDTNVMQPLNVWLNHDQNNETALQRTLINPLRDELMPKADGAISKVQQIDETYKTTLQEPVETAVASQRVIRTLIAEYRQQHQV